MKLLHSVHLYILVVSAVPAHLTIHCHYSNIVSDILCNTSVVKRLKNN